MTLTLPQQRTESLSWERPAALGLAFVLGLNVPLPYGFPVGFVLAGALLPVTITTWRRYAGIRVIALVAALAAVSGAFLTWVAASTGSTDTSMFVAETARVLLLGLGTMALLWARAVAGSRVLGLVYGLGLLFNRLLAITPANPENPWKFGYSVPVILILLCLPMIYGRRTAEFVTLTGLAAVSVLNDSRSAAAMLLIAAAVVLTVRPSDRAPRSPVKVAAGIGLLSVAGFYLVQAAILEGVLGEAAQERTVQQIQTSGNVLLGGRPEAGATVALFADRPWGHGAGTLASPTDILVAKGGMSALGYQPDNGYVERYMFGNGFEVHSLVGDLWVRFGLLGILLAVTVLFLVGRGAIGALSSHAATGVLLFLTIRTAWDFAFSPFLTVMNTLMLAIALTMPRSRDPEAQAGTPPRDPHPLASTSDGTGLAGSKPAGRRPLGAQPKGRRRRAER